MPYAVATEPDYNVSTWTKGFRGLTAILVGKGLHADTRIILFNRFGNRVYELVPHVAAISEHFMLVCKK